MGGDSVANGCKNSVFVTQFQKSVQGFEMTYAVNHLATFLLTQSLLPLLKKSAQARVVTVSSIAHQNGVIDFKNLNAEKGFDGYSTYALSKLCNVLFTYHLAAQLKNTNITANCLHPGVISTKLLKIGFGMGGDSVANGCKNSVFVATSPALTNISGKYFVNRIDTPSAAITYQTQIQKQLWEVSCNHSAG
jgi:NAD(P)-dependent dehydrogenase (short-subunit alcohol dehydrogenase family)